MKHKPGRSQQERDDAMARASIDGRAAFAAAVFFASLAIFALLDRIGAPGRLVATLGPALAILGLSTIGFMLRSMRIIGFHAAGRATPGVYAGLAMVALGAGLAVPFAPPGLGNVSLSSLLTGFGAGMALAGLLVGPLLRKSGAFCVADMIAMRFPSLTLSVGVTLAIAAIGLCLGLAGLALAQSALAQATTLGPQASLILASLVVALIVVPGGMAGLVWSSASAAGVMIAVVAAPLVLMIASGATTPLPLPGDVAFEQALARMAQWRGESEQAQGLDPVFIGAVALGLGALPPLLAPLMTASRRGEARSGGLAGFVWIALLCFMGLATIAAAALALQSRPSDSTGAFLLSALPEIKGFGAAFSGLAIAGRLAIAMTLSAAGFMTLATAWGERAFYQTHKSHSLTSGRLALTRCVLFAAIAGAAWLQINTTTDPHLLIGAAIGLSAVAIAPLLVLALWPRADGQDAAVGLVVGLAMAEAAMLVSGELNAGVLAGAAMTGFVSAAASGAFASMRHPAGPVTDGEAFVHGLLHGKSDVLRPDKNA